MQSLPSNLPVPGSEHHLPCLDLTMAFSRSPQPMSQLGPFSALESRQSFKHAMVPPQLVLIPYPQLHRTFSSSGMSPFPRSCCGCKHAHLHPQPLLLLHIPREVPWPPGRCPSLMPPSSSTTALSTWQARASGFVCVPGDSTLLRARRGFCLVHGYI